MVRKKESKCKVQSKLFAQAFCFHFFVGWAQYEFGGFERISSVKKLSVFTQHWGKPWEETKHLQSFFCSLLFSEGSAGKRLMQTKLFHFHKKPAHCFFSTFFSDKISKTVWTPFKTFRLSQEFPNSANRKFLQLRRLFPSSSLVAPAAWMTWMFSVVLHRSFDCTF